MVKLKLTFFDFGERDDHFERTSKIYIQYNIIITIKKKKKKKDVVRERKREKPETRVFNSGVVPPINPKKELEYSDGLMIQVSGTGQFLSAPPPHIQTKEKDKVTILYRYFLQFIFQYTEIFKKF